VAIASVQATLSRRDSEKLFLSRKSPPLRAPHSLIPPSLTPNHLVKLVSSSAHFLPLFLFVTTCRTTHLRKLYSARDPRQISRFRAFLQRHPIVRRKLSTSSGSKLIALTVLRQSRRHFSLLNVEEAHWTHELRRHRVKLGRALPIYRVGRVQGPAVRRDLLLQDNPADHQYHPGKAEQTRWRLHRIR